MTQSECNTRGPGILALYLAVMAIPALLGAVRHDAWSFALGHLALLGLTLALIRVRPDRDWIGWLPLVAVPFLYAELPVLMSGFGAELHDGLVQRLELSIFGASPAATLAGRYASPFISELLHLGYLSYYALVYVPPAIAWLAGRRDVFARTVTGLAAVFCVSFAIFALFPVAGPRYEWAAPAGVPDGPIRRLVLAILAAGSSRGAAFPSSHVAVSVAQTVMALRWQRAVGVPAAVATVLLAIGAVYGGFHYGIDVLAGAVLGLALGYAVVKVTEREGLSDTPAVETTVAPV